MILPVRPENPYSNPIEAQEYNTAFTLGNLVGQALVHASQIEELYYDATHDSLTGLLNRRGFTETSALLLADMERAGHGDNVAVVNVDLTNFKAINDRRGHKTGDDVLVMMKPLLKDNLRTDDILGRSIVGRMGGDEFLVFLNLTPSENDVKDYTTPRGNQEMTPDERAQHVKDRLDDTLKRAVANNPFLNELHQLCGFDIATGVVVRNGNESIESMILRSEKAMTESKDVQHISNGKYRTS